MYVWKVSKSILQHFCENLAKLANLVDFCSITLTLTPWNFFFSFFCTISLYPVNCPPLFGRRENVL
jgi:hypothetical protein